MYTPTRNRKRKGKITIAPTEDQTPSPLRLRAFLLAARPGQRLVYFVGNLGEQRARDRNLAEIARGAYEAAEKGECVLLQKRYGRPEEGNTIYMIERRGSDHVGI